MLPSVDRHKRLNSNTIRNVPNLENKSERSNVLSVVSRKYRILYRQFLNRSQLEKKLVACILIGAIAFAVTTSLLLYISLKYDKSNLCTKPGCIFSATRLLEGMNMSINPCENFYEYVCGKWSTEHVNPLDEANSWFTERTKILNNKIKDILEQPLFPNDLKPVLQMKRFYKLCTDTANLHRKGLQPLFQVLTLVGLPLSLPTEENTEHLNLAKTLAHIQRLLNFDLVVQLSTRFNTINNMNLLSIGAASNEISLLNQRNQIIRDKYNQRITTEEYLIHQVSYMTAVMVEMTNGSINVDDITREALKIIFLEAQLKLSIDEGDKDAEMYITINELQMLMFSQVPSVNLSTFNWADYIQVLTENLNISLDMDSTVHVTNPHYFQALGTHLATLKLINFQRFVWWKVIDALVPHTTDVMRMHEYMFDQYVLRGIVQVPTRSLLCLDMTKTVFHGVVAFKLASYENLTKVTKNVNNIMSNIKEVFRKMIINSNWIDEDTKNKSIFKVNAVKSFIGYPEKVLNSSWITEHYKKVTVTKNDFLGSVLMLRSQLVDDVLNTIHKSERIHFENESWSVNPTEVNAYYSREINSIAIPSGILQYPFYIDGIEALNYGAIGSILGHELTHGFDSEGKNYDWNGDKKSTWNESIIRAYNNRSKCFIDQYSDYIVAKNITVNGNATLAENIADNGGIKEAYYAYEEFVRQNGTELLLPGFEDFTHMQLLFISFANIWCKKQNEISVKFNTLDEHSPNIFRVIGSLSNLPEFSTTWNCDAASPMNPIRKCLLW